MGRKITIPEEIAQAIEAHLYELGAASVEEYVAAVLRERLVMEGFLSAYSPEQRQEVERQLRDLGYLD